ncbi:cytochrome P450 [Solirubrobacter ginsenosidimutans]|uniref:Cytochrome P450 n=1 Tax=Solirubrobacter ginsenosidimutans TaxID=490573 RepID=A0A9X3MNN9_9ACTN|nr:cytochrome P450 [Solirubrobacter ginsenosidimutans]MDA0159067.1 cytochrome P450 [Solirubrobacter ginsenosidimutans]
MSIAGVDIDLFSTAVLEEPWAAYAALRERGPAVYLDRYGVWAIPRYDEVFAMLRDHQTFSSAPVPALEPERPDMEAARHSILGSDPPRHTTLRAVLSEQLSPRALRTLRADIETQADAVVAGLVERGTYDAVQDLARRFPVEVVARLVGLPEDAREPLLALADAAFNTFGPANELTQASWSRLPEIGGYIAQVMTRETIAPGSWGAAVYAAADRGDISEPDAIQMMNAFIVAGMDTTVNSIGSAIWLLAERPDTWAALREDPSLVRSAYEEALRYESPVSFFCRGVTRPTEVGGVQLDAGDRVMLLFGAANRDERHYADADRFDVRRNPLDHVAFGGGIHGCAGQGLARIEGPAVLGALVRHVEFLELAGEPSRHLNNAVRGLERLPIATRTS